MNTITSTIRRFGKANGAINYRSNSPIQVDILRHLAPSIFAEDRHSSRSERYTYVPTHHLLQEMGKAGFRPFAVMQGGSRDAEKRGFTKHLLRFRHESQSLAVGESTPEIVMINSHDGTSSYQLMAGVFRLVCSNGLVVADSMLENVRVKHSGDIVGNVIDGCIDIMGRLPEVQESVREMQSLTLTDGERKAYAEAALMVRYGDDKPPMQPTQILEPKRYGDDGHDVWRTLNTVQENMIRGSVRYRHQAPNGEISRRRTREVNGIDQNTGLNRALWHLAEEMRRLKTSA